MKTLDDLKREIWEALGDEHHLVAQELTLRAVIDYLHSQGRIVPDGYVAIDATEIPIKKPHTIFYHDDIGKTVTMDEQTYLALNNCAVLLDKAMIAAATAKPFNSRADAKKGDE